MRRSGQNKPIRKSEYIKTPLENVVPELSVPSFLLVVMGNAGQTQT